MQQEKGYLSRTLFNSAHTPGDSWLHRLPVVWKIGLALLLAAGAVLGGWPGIAILAAAGVAGCCLSQFSLLRMLKRMKSFFWFLFLAGMFPVLFASGTPVQALDGLPFTLTLEGLETGAQNTSRFALMFMISLLFIHTTHPKTWMPVACAPSSAHLSGWRASIQEIVAVAGMAFQLLPLICIEADRWWVTKLNAGKERLSRNIFKKARQVAALLVPLVVSVLADMDRIAEECGPEENRI